MWKLLLAFALFVGVSVAQADAVQVFGFTIGQPIARDIPACKGPSYPDVDYCSSSAYQSGSVPSDRRLSLLIPFRPAEFTLPLWIKRGHEYRLQIWMDAAGNVIGLEAPTVGASQQERVIHAVTEKFGQPVKSVNNDMQNAMGAKWSVADVTWVREGINVQHICYAMNGCNLVIATRQRQEERDAERAERMKKDRL